MVSTLSMAFMGISAGISVLFPILLIIYFRKKYRISYKTVGIGAFTFFLFSQVLEKMLHSFVIGNNLIKNPIVFALYGALAAGIFEEVGRFFTMRALMKGQTQWKDGAAFGIGHGGIEAILIGTLGNAQNLVYSTLINSGTFENVISAQVKGNTAAEQAAAQIKNALINTSPTLFALGGIERIFTMAVHIGFSIMVLYGIKKRKNIYLLFAILLHSLLDFFAALYQVNKLNIFVVETIVALFAIGAVIYGVNIKEKFE